MGTKFIQVLAVGKTTYLTQLTFFYLETSF